MSSQVALIDITSNFGVILSSIREAEKFLYEGKRVDNTSIEVFALERIRLQ